jgi:hypothetical protein
MLWVLHVMNLLLIIPMMAIGMMMGLSGGGTKPILQFIGARMLVWSPMVAVLSVITSEILWQLDFTIIAYIVNLIPLTMWVLFIGRIRFDHLFERFSTKSEG